MSRHSFDPDVAAKVGLNAAVVYQNIVWWCERNAAKGRNIKDGNAWTFNSVSTFCDLFPYLTADQIRRALEKLEAEKLVEVGNFNEDARDRTKWFALHRDSEAFGKFVSLHLAKLPETFGKIAEPLPDSKPDSKHTPIPPKGADDLFSAKEEQRKPDQTSVLFDRFWNVYPIKAGKPEARKAFVKAIKKADPEIIIARAKRYADWLRDAKPGEFRPAPKHPQGWLNGERWADEEISAPRSNRFLDIAREYGGGA